MDPIRAKETYNKIYFSSYYPGSVDLVIDPDVRYAKGPITLTVAAAEVLLTNLQINAEHARLMAQAKGEPAPARRAKS